MTAGSTRAPGAASIWRKEVWALLDDGAQGDVVARHLATRVEEHLQAQLVLPEGTTLLAQGGLARRELAPFADVDVLVVVDDDVLGPQQSAAAEQAAAAQVLALWDHGLRLSHAVRRLSALEALFERVMHKDGHAATALLGARHVHGDAALSARVRRLVLRGLVPAHRAPLLVAKRTERGERRRRHGESAAVSEPDLKQGTGGLRDLHALGWFGALLFGEAAYASDGDTLRALLAAGQLFDRELTTLIAARAELLQLQAALHSIAGRADEHLHAEHAQNIARTFPLLRAHGPLMHGETDGESVSRRAANALCEVKRVGLAVLSRWGIEDSTEARLQRAAEGREMLAHANATGTASRIRRLAERAAETDVTHPLPLPAVAAPEGEARVQARRGEEQVAAARALVGVAGLTVLRADARPFAALLESGLLGQVLPEVERLHGRVRHDGVHTLAVDAHLALCADYAVRTVCGCDALPPPLLPSLARLTRPHLFVLSALFHDIGKGTARNHSEEGADIVNRHALALGLTHEETAILRFLVSDHLLLSKTSQRRDLGDPRVIAELAAAVGDVERLDLLALLTWVDMRAVSPGTATEWKAGLLGTAVSRARAHLRAPNAPDHAGFGDTIRANARTALAALGGAELEAARVAAFVEAASLHFLLARDPVALTRDLHLVESALPGAAVARTHPCGGDVHELSVCAPDRSGLLADVTRVLASEGVNVLDATLDVRGDGRAFDVFLIDGGRGRALAEETAQHVAAVVERTLARGSTDTSVARTPHSVPPAKPIAGARARVVEFDTWERAVVEVRTRDRRGLLATIARAVAAQGLTIALARIHTEGERVTDVFTIAGADGGRPPERALQELLVDLVQIAAS